LRSPDQTPALHAPVGPLLAKELREIFDGRALWAMLLLVCPLMGYSFFQAVSLYGDASSAASDSPVLAHGLSPLDGILVPSFGAFYVAVTLLFPFVAIRVLGGEKETGALRLLVQLPYRSFTLIAVKLAAVFAAWLLASIPVLSVLVIWLALGGHLHGPETLNLFLGHVLYGLLVGAIALFAASVTESAATAAIIALAFTIGSWVLDFTIAGQPGFLAWISVLSLTQALHTFEQGLLSAGLVLGLLTAIGGFAALSAIWLPPGLALGAKLVRTTACVVATAIVLGLATQIRLSIDLTEDRRNSFSAADQQALVKLREPLTIGVHLAPEDPRYADLQRNVLAKLERTMPNVAVHLIGNRGFAAGVGEETYGEVEYAYGARREVSRSTSPREVLPLIYRLANTEIPRPSAADDYPGYPLVAKSEPALLWFFIVLPLLISVAWWWTRQPPRIDPTYVRQGAQP
jgi:ABC-2 type transport system permease protein